MRPEIRKHALFVIVVGGVAAGVAQGLPLGVVSSCCCTPWSLIGAVLAVGALVQLAKAKVEPGEGGVVGLGVGAIAGAIGGVLGALRTLLSNADGMLGAFLRDRHEVMGFGAAQYVWGAIVVFLVHLLFGITLGPLGGWLASTLVKPPAYAGPPPRQ